MHFRMSDLDCFPLYIQPEEGINLPNGGLFTLHENNVPDLLSGSRLEWNRMLLLLLTGWRDHKGFMSETMLLATTLASHGDRVAHVVKQGEEVSSAFLSSSFERVDCTKYHRGIKVVHVSLYSKSDAFLWGWLEAELREMYETLLMEDDRGFPVRKNAERTGYELGKGEITLYKIYLDGKQPLKMSEVFNMHRPQLATRFLKAIEAQCQ